MRRRFPTSAKVQKAAIKKHGGNMAAAGKEFGIAGRELWDVMSQETRKWYYRMMEERGWTKQRSRSREIPEAEIRRRMLVIKKNRGNMAAAARELKMKTSTLQSWVNKEEDRVWQVERIKNFYRGWEGFVKMAAIEKHGGNIAAAERELGPKNSYLWKWVNRNKQSREWYEKIKKVRGWKKQTGGPLSTWESVARLAAIEKHGGNINRAARELGMEDRRTLWMWINSNKEIKEWVRKLREKVRKRKKRR